MAEGTVRLNIGSGAKLLPGFINVDLPNNWADTKPDVEADATKPLPFADDYADELHAYHLLEHLNRWEAPEILADWKRVLKPDGLLVLEMPCLNKIVRIMAHCMIDGKPFDRRLTIWGLFGDPHYKNEAMSHKWCYSAEELADMLTELGMVDIEASAPKTHQPSRDMRMTCRKPHGAELRA